MSSNYMHEDKEQQLFFMRRAILLGEKGRCTTPPNPWVGCLLVKEGRVVGEGYHKKVGEPHAEIVALAQAHKEAEGASAFITLEPCCHVGRTPPCIEALVKAKVKKVFIPFLDPDPLVAGRGVEKLQKAGVIVEVGMGKEEARRSLAPYLYHREHGIPYCILKTAISIDGYTATEEGRSKWITGVAARQDAKRLRAESQAIIVGVETAIQDHPSLVETPLRVVMDRKGRLKEEGPLFDGSASTLIFTETKKQWKNAESCQVFSLKEALQELGKRGVIQLFVEGGATLHASFVKENFVQKWVVYIGNTLLGQGKRMLNDIKHLSLEHRLQLESVVKLGDDVRLIYIP